MILSFGALGAPILERQAVAEFTIAGVTRRLTSKEVVSRLRSAKPGPIREHCVEVDGVVHPIKEAFSRVTGLDVLDFNTNQARSVFKRLGFRVMRSH